MSSPAWFARNPKRYTLVSGVYRRAVVLGMMGTYKWARMWPSYALFLRMMRRLDTGSVRVVVMRQRGAWYEGGHLVSAWCMI